MIALTLILVGLTVVVFIIIPIYCASRRNRICARQAEINRNTDNALQNAAFAVSKKFYLNDFNTFDRLNDFKKFIAADSENKKICLVDYENNKLFLLDFADILDYEIYENGDKVSTGASVNGYFTGVFGVTTTDLCKELRLIIRLKRVDAPHVTYDIVSDTNFNSGVKKIEKIYKQCIATLQEVVSFLEVIKHENSLPHEA